MSGLADLARGNGGGSFGVTAGKKRKKSTDDKASLDLDALCGGKVALNKDVSDSSFVCHLQP